MYCPHCGVQNSDQTRFCRGCGEDLRLISQAVTKSLPLVIAQRVDAAIDRGRGGWRSYQLFRAENRRPYAQTLMGLCSLFVITWMLMLGHGSVSFASGFLLVMTISALAMSVRELLDTRKRPQQQNDSKEFSSSVRTKELPESRAMPTTSITESTTRDLQARSARASREDNET